MASQPQEFPPGVNVNDGGVAQIDDTLSKLPDSAFRVCWALKEVSLPLSLQFLGEYCFAQCCNLKHLAIPSSVEVIEKAAVFYCNRLEQVTFGQEQSRLRVIGDYSFAMCSSLRSIETPDSVEYIGLKAFRACRSLGSVIVHGDKVKVLREKVFEECVNLAHVTLPTSVTRIAKGAFQGCFELQMINLSEGLREVGSSAFNGCQKMKGNEIALRYAPRPPPKKPRISQNPKKKLPPIEAKVVDGRLLMSANIVELPDRALKNWRMLVEVDFPNTVRIIGEFCFANCIKLETVRIPDSLEVIRKGAFHSCCSLTKLIWSVKQSRLRVLGEQAFICCRKIKKIETPEGVVVIGDKTFSGCTDLEHFVMNGCHGEVIGKEAFLGCLSLITAQIPSIIHIHQKAFESCPSVEFIKVSQRLRIIGQGSFRGCRSLRNFNFPEGLEIIENEAMANCTSLEFVRVPVSLVRIGTMAFSSCSSLLSVVMPPKELSRLESIGERAFESCSALVNISIPATTSVAPHALYGCRKLESLIHCYGAQLVFEGFGMHMGHYRSTHHSERDLVNSFTTRFDRLPLHQLCYHQSYYETEELMERLKGQEKQKEWRSKREPIDIAGMSPLHLLALTRTTRYDIWKHMLERDFGNVVPDELGNFPLVYLLRNRCPMSFFESYFSILYEHDQFHPTLECIVEHTANCYRDDLRSILRLALRTWVGQLGHEQWRNAILHEVDRICDANYQSERKRLVSNLQWTLLPKLTEKEILSLLELAIWKARIVKQEGEMTSSTVDTTSIAFRQESRLQCGDEVVIPHIRPFLDFSTDDDGYD
ncbi:unnamed protein product [Cylindrotheca closterium]|uniref:Uncharacterized protein n=1 Tax=Cylindrotheca closterium TaxID=2856 RepID=A0AAD2FRD6_9STRA|nr:unnamed protein product [Cylindrotheca closterium]